MSDPVCPLCDRPIPAEVKQSRHHLVPKLKGGKGIVIGTVNADDNGFYQFEITPDMQYQLTGTKEEYFDGKTPFDSNNMGDKTVIDAIKAAHAGEDYIPADVAAILVQSFRSPHVQGPLELTPRETEIATRIRALKEKSTRDSRKNGLLCKFFFSFFWERV